VGYGALIAHRCPQRWFPTSFLLADDPGVERSVNTRGVSRSQSAKISSEEASSAIWAFLRPSGGANAVAGCLPTSRSNLPHAGL